MKLIRTNALRALVEAEVGPSLITDRWREITTLVAEQCGSDVAQLFAEPSISRSNGASEAIARWYSEVDGPAVSFAALDSAGRGAAGAHLTSVLTRLEPLLRNPGTAELIGPCVQIPSMAEVMVVGGRPVLVNWGMLPEAVAGSPTQREAHFRTTLGQFLPGVSAPSFTTSGRWTFAGPTRSMPPPTFDHAGTAPMATADVAAAAPPPIKSVEPRRDRTWIPIAIATGMALAVLLFLLIPGVLIYPDQSGVSASEVDRTQENNHALEARVDDLKRQLSEAVCTPQNTTGTAPKPTAPDQQK